MSGRKSLDRVIEVLDVHPIGHLLSDPDGRVIYFNPALERLIGYSAEDIPDEAAWFSLLHDDPDDRYRGMVAFHSGLTGMIGSGKRHYSRLITRDGESIGCLFSFTVIDGLHMITVEAWDEGIVPEGDLESSEDRFRLLVESMVEIVALHEMVYEGGGAVDYRVLDCNAAFERMIDMPREQVIGHRASELCGWEEAPLLDIYAEAVKSGLRNHLSTYDTHLDKYFDVTVIPTEEGQFWTVSVDTTEHTTSMKALAESEMRYRLISDGQDNLVAKIDPEGTLLFMSPSFQRFFGLDESHLGTKYRPRIHPDDHDAVMRMHREWRSPPHQASCDARTCSVDGIRTVNWTSRGMGKGPDHYIILGRDVTDIREAERGLRMHRYSTDESDDAVLFLDMGGRIVYVNDTGLRMTGVSREALEGMSVFDMLSELDPTLIESVSERLDSEGSQRTSVTLPTDDGAVELDVTVSPLVMEGVEFLHLHARDVTEAARQRERLNASLDEKTTLLQEVHHRVKNNLATVNSMLMMQMSTVDDERVRGVLLDAENRIMSMAMVHESVYRSESFGNIEMGGHLERLAREVVGSSPRGEGIELRVDSVECHMDLDHAVPISLVVNELLTNSIKYAFPDVRGCVSIHIDKDDGSATLTISDDGTGMPEGFDVTTRSSLGIRLVQNIVEKQLGGSLELVDAPGTVWRIDLPRGC